MPEDTRDYGDLQAITKEKQLMQIQIKLDRLIDCMEFLMRRQSEHIIGGSAKDDLVRYLANWHVTQ